MHVVRYTSKQKSLWNDFLSTCVNQSFLFNRDYMEYHADRYYDCSLIIFEKDKIIAILPGVINEYSWVSHSGLSYGGLIYKCLKQDEVINAMKMVIDFLLNMNIKHIKLKIIPDIYLQNRDQSMHYALFYLGFKLIGRDASSTIYFDEKFEFSTNRKRQIKKSIKEEVIFHESKNITSFFDILNKNLLNKYKTYAVHTAEEMTLLSNLFPSNIKLFIIKKKKDILAGAIIYLVGKVAHLQYSATTEIGKKYGFGDFLIFKILEKYKNSNIKIFDFGISTEKQGNYFNNSLYRYKESFGAKTTVNDHYEKYF